ncbi:hypothetical protein CLIB1444_15S01046 [[Candida] jaroonii]|uniref:Uncharacterized protein n=1 Tax=[Candida] jaroonii TaxID=467808 RepID=A0ACA9YFJ9_9ASCO|nr:hypothetical protein CLIB1444_15S01046 [[Candida] jaroonii]
MGKENTSPDLGAQPVFNIPKDLTKVAPEDIPALKYLMAVQSAQKNISSSSHTVDIGKHNQVGSQVRTEVKGYSEPKIKTDFKYWQLKLYEDFMKLKDELYELYIYKDLPVSTSTKNWVKPVGTAAWKKFIHTNPPSTMEVIFKRLDQPQVLSLLVLSRKMLNSKSNTNLCKWIYVLCLRLNDQLDSSDISVVRLLAQRCLRILQQQQDNENWELNSDVEFACHFVILIVNKHFGQRDIYWDTD